MTKKRIALIAILTIAIILGALGTLAMLPPSPGESFQNKIRRWLHLPIVEPEDGLSTK
jgi:hypothetical protein